MTTKDDIKRWFQQGEDEEALFMLVICDTYDHTDYPVYCFTEEDCWEKYYNPGNMARVMEVYDLTIDIEEQLSERRCFNLPKEEK